MPPSKPTRRQALQTALAATGSATLASPATAASTADEPLFAYIGTFSSPLQDVLPTQVDLPPGNGRGIHIFEVNRTTGKLTPRGTFDLGTSPSCLAVNNEGTRLYSANETDRVGDGEEKQGTLSSFRIDRRTGALQMLNTVPAGGAGPTYVSLHPNGRFLMSANYFGGSISVFPVNDDGTLGPMADFQQDDDNVGPPRAVNAPPGSFAFSGHDRTHAHQIAPSPDGRFVLHVDLGQDRIYIWKFDAATGKLTPASKPWITLPEGDGPRHFHFHPNGRWFYSIQEEGSTIVLFDYDRQTGALTKRQTVPSLPEGYAGSNFCSEILVSHDGRFVYGGNRLHDSIGIFAVATDGTLKQTGNEWTRGNYPRSFAFDPTGNFLYCCNQRADNVTVFRVNLQTGALDFTGLYTAVGNPSMILFLDTADR